jgi:hypothetical protein
VITKTSAIAGALCALLTAPVLAAPPQMMNPAGTPIQISGCGTQRGPGSTGQEQPGSIPAVAWLSFTNTGKQPIDRIAFDLESNGMHYLVTTNGSYAPGTKVDRVAMAGILPITFQPASCSIIGVHYADGTSWMR